MVRRAQGSESMVDAVAVDAGSYGVMGQVQVVIVESRGECVDGICRYTPSYIDCPYGCENAVCLPAPDGGVVEAEVWDAGQMAGINDAGQPPAVLDAGSSSEPPEPSVQMMKMALIDHDRMAFAF